MILISTFYNDKSPSRQRELELVLNKNINNELLHKIILFCEQIPNQNLPEKVKVIEVAKRLSFNELIFHSNKYQTDDLKILSNADIFFDESLGFLVNEFESKVVYCLTRWDYQEGSNPVFYENFKSQDAWIFRGKLPDNIGNYYMGLPGCDNRFAKELIDAGHKIQNPCLSVRAIHVHGSNSRNYHKTSDRIFGEYAYPLPIEMKNHRTSWGNEMERKIRLKFLHRKWRNDLAGVKYTILERVLAKLTLFYFKYCSR